MTHSRPSQPADSEPRLLPLRGSDPQTFLGSLLESIAADVAEDRRRRRLPPVRLEIDVATSHAVAADVDMIRAGLMPLMMAACEAATSSRGAAGAGPRVCEVVVTSVDTGTAIEIEVADSATGFAGGLPAATAVAVAAARSVADRCGGGVELAACPEGGVAVTLRFPHRRVRGLAA